MPGDPAHPSPLVARCDARGARSTVPRAHLVASILLLSLVGTDAAVPMPTVCTVEPAACAVNDAGSADAWE